ncbi:MAG: hypothetical protein ACXWDI_10405 [Nocardioides sp.]
MTTAAHPVQARSPLVVPALGTALVSTALLALGTFADGTEGAENSVPEFLVLAAVTVAATAVVFAVVLPRALSQPSAPRAALVLAVLAAVLVVPAFWSGLVLPLAVGGLLAGRHTRSTAGNIAVALSALSIVGLVAIYVLDWLSTNGVL